MHIAVSICGLLYFCVPINNAHSGVSERIEFWENIWNNGGLLFNGSKWTFRLPDLYIKQERYDDALSILRRIRNPSYSDKKKSYIERIEKLKQRSNKKSK